MNTKTKGNYLQSFKDSKQFNPFKQLADELAEVILITDVDHKVIYANHKAHEIFGSVQKNLQGQKVDIDLKDSGKYIIKFSSKDKQLYFQVETKRTRWDDSEALIHFLSDRTEQTDTEKLLQKNSYDLKERNKELSALYEVSRLTSDMSLDIENLAVKLLEIIPHSWQFPEIAQARIKISGSEFISENFKKNIHRQSADIFVNGTKEGFIEVGYCQLVPDNKNAFLEEEKALIENIAFRTGKFIEKKRSQTDLKLQSDLLNSVGEAVIATDLHGFINFWNKRAEEMYGWKSEEVTGKNILEVNVSSEMKASAESLMASLRQGKSWTGKFVVRRKNGELFPVIVTNSPLRDESGNLKGIIGISRDISEIVRAEDALKDSFEKLNNVADNMPGTIFQFKRSNDGKYSLPFVSGRSQELFGLSPEEAMNNFDLVYEAIHPDDRVAFKQNIENSFRNLTAYKSQHRTLLKDGSIRWFEANSLPKKLPNNDVLWTGVVLDMTDFKETENLLKESEERFTDISENLPGLVYQFELLPDGNFNIPYISKSAEKIFRRPLHQIMNEARLMKNIHPDDMDDLLKSIYESAEKVSPWFREIRIILDDGEIKWIQGRAVPRKKINGSILWNGVLVDITEQKYAELALQENEEKLREAQQIAELGNFHLILPERKIRWSVEIANLLGIPYSKELVDLVEFRDLIKAKDRWKIPYYIEQVTNTGNSASFDLKIKSKDSENLFIHVTGKPQKDKSGKVVSIIGTAMNITKRKTYEIELKKAKEKAEESDRLKSVFLQTMSHELRTPLNAIIGFSDLILEDEIGAEQHKEFINLINNSGKHLLDIIEDIFEISALETGQSEPRYEEVNLLDLFTGLNPIIEEEKKKRHKDHLSVKFVPLGQQRDKIIKTDPAKLKRMITNLMVNALKFTSRGSIEYGYKIYRKRVLFYVKDTGIGIEPDKQKVIFERFRQAEESPTREYEGVGLGLSICKIISELLGGDIWVESGKGKGSTFYFMHPVVEEVAVAAEVEVKEKSSSDTKLFTDKKVLIVEDEKSNMHLLELMLKHLGAVILKATNGQEALDLFKTEKSIDLILMDIKMPVMNGLDATRSIRKLNKQVPIIALTAYAQEGDRQKAFDAGCSDYISKPLRKGMLVNKMKSHLIN